VICDLKGKPITESGVSRIIGMPRATLARRIDLLTGSYIPALN
jgi:hypothetical protein